MLSLRDLQQAEGYYVNVRTGELIRNIGPGYLRSWSWTHASWEKLPASWDWNDLQFELLTTDLSASFETLQGHMQAWCREIGHP